MPESIWAVVLVALWALLLMQTVMIVLLSRHMRRLYEERAPDAAGVGPAAGAVVPEIDVMDIAGRSLSLGGGTPTKRLLLFLSPNCPGCRTAIREIHRVPPELAQTILLWSTSDAQARDLAEEYQIDLPMVADPNHELWRQFSITGVPFAVVVDETGRVAAKAFAHSAEQLEALLTSSDHLAGRAMEFGGGGTTPKGWTSTAAGASSEAVVAGPAVVGAPPGVRG